MFFLKIDRSSDTDARDTDPGSSSVPRVQPDAHRKNSSIRSTRVITRYQDARETWFTRHDDAIGIQVGTLHV